MTPNHTPPNQNKENLKEEFFRRLADKLDELFPKLNRDDPTVPSPNHRSEALVLNAFANIIFRELLSHQLEEIEKEVVMEEGNNSYYKNIYPPNSKWKEGWDDCRAELLVRFKKLKEKI